MMGVRAALAPLDRLAANGLLTNRAPGEDDRSWLERNKSMSHAGHRFAQLHRQLQGGSTRPTATIAIDIQRPLDRFAAARYRQSRNALAMASQAVLKAVTDASVLHVLPDEGTEPGKYRVALQNLRRGLSILEDLPSPSEYGA